MKSNVFLFIPAFLFFTLNVSAQKKIQPLLLKSGTIETTPTLSAARVDSLSNLSPRFKAKAIVLLQFEKRPTEATRNELHAAGIELLDYVPQNAYTALITGKLNEKLLQQWNIRAADTLTPAQKMHPALAGSQMPGRRAKGPATVDVQILFPKAFGTTEVTAALRKKNIAVVSDALGRYQILSLRIAATRLAELAACPFVLYVQPELPKDQPLNFRSRVASRSAALNTAVANGGRGLNGDGVVIGIGDDADVQFHPDFSGRLINRSSATASSHGTHVHGTAAGAGVVNELYQGYAPKATIVSQNFSNILFYAPEYVQDYGMVITNNSYGRLIPCSEAGGYDIYSYILDQQAFDYPSLQHVFAAGNSGQGTCAPYPTGYLTVRSSYQAAKNVLTVASTDYLGNVAASSSKGPVMDGRIKPEIAAMGEAVVSSVPATNYAANSGTSMSSPAVAGGLALLYQRYRQLNSGANPKSALMKALLCNGATDKGTAGPDYAYGFGFMNVERSVMLLENNRYISDAITDGGLKTHTIAVPSNTAQLKVMLYWHDPQANLMSTQALVNDLDLKVISPSTAITFPKILNPAATNVLAAATEGPDHLNNIEQVIIDNPVAGNYTLNIEALVAQNPAQDYFIVYDFIQPDLKLTFPSAGAALVPGEQTLVAWDSYGGSNTFTLEYSTDSGATWTAIASGLDAASRSYNWTVPAAASSQVLIMLKKDGTLLSDTSAPFTIIGTPTAALATTANQCEGYINMTWSNVAGATDYEVMWLRNDEMVPTAVTTATNYTFSSLAKDSLYWVGVRARINGRPGRRSVSVSRRPNNGSCSGAISNNDLKLAAIVAPLSGRKHTSTELTTAAVKVSIKNLDNATVAACTVGYKINSGAWVFENVSTAIAAAGTYTHTFGSIENFAAVGSYVITAVVKNNVTDIAVANDTLTRVVKQLPNQALDLATPFLDDLESAAIETYMTDTAGLTGADRYDFKPGTYGRLRTFVNSGVAFSGAKALAVDIDRALTAGPLPVQYLTGTFNLSSYNAVANDLRLQFNSINGSHAASNQNRVWIRGADTQPWIEAYTPFAAGASASIEIGDLLSSQSQNFSSSFQVRWGVPATGQVVAPAITQGLLLDDISLYEVFNDVQLLRIDTPYALNCGLSSAVPVVITVRNTSPNTLTNVTVQYALNGGTWLSEIIASIPANTTIQHRFASMVNLTLPGLHTITAVALHGGDTYHANDTLTQTIYNSEVVTAFPHLQNFESGSGGWYSDGANSSWQFGTPASPAINRAASGANAWKTALSGMYNNAEVSFLYSPCYVIAGMAKPTISFSAAIDVENCGASFCDGVWLEYSTDGQNWYNLADLTSSGTNWYTAPHYAWTIENYTAWHVATMSLPAGFNTIRFRFVLQSDEAVTREGIAIDDFHIYDNTKGIYTGPTLSAAITQTVSGNSWSHFESGGKLIASILPNNQALGSTDVEAYIHTGAVRHTTNTAQYYHNRNITIKPSARNLSAPATVRFYFLDGETTALLNAAGCAGCSKPASAYNLGVSKFTSSNMAIENGTINDNRGGNWSYILPANVAKVPFDKGYYAEFQVADFSEFWLNNGSFTADWPLPVRQIDFTATRKPDAVLLTWITADEQAVDSYEIEVARGVAAYRSGAFQTIGSVKSTNTAAQRQYHFADEKVYKNGLQYYRLKIVDTDGTFRYSEVRSVLFEETVAWHVYPNPSGGVFYFIYQAGASETLHASVKDVSGKTVRSYTLTATGFLQKQLVDLTGLPAGVYLLQAERQGRLCSYRLFKK